MKPKALHELTPDDLIAKPVQAEWFLDFENPDAGGEKWDSWAIWDSDYGWRIARGGVYYCADERSWHLMWRTQGDKQWALDCCGVLVLPYSQEGAPVPVGWDVVKGREE